MIKKNDEYELVIDDIGSEGEGIGHIDSVTGHAGKYALFVKDALPGDRVLVKVMKTKKNYGYARLLKILKPSDDRVEPRCALARQCGGCQLQHLSYEKQLEYKENKIKNCLERIGGYSRESIEDIMEPIIGMDEPYYYRNKAQFPVGMDKEGNIITGFYAGRTHSIIDMNHCYIQNPVNEELLEIIKGFMKEFGIEPYQEEADSGLIRHILTRIGHRTGEIMVCLIINGNKLPHSQELVDRLRNINGMTSISLNVNKNRTNVILGEKVITLWGQDYITDYIGDVKYRISPLSFYQVNPIQTGKLYGTALEYAGLHGEEVVWDIYCGIGTISLFLAQKAKQVYGVEIVPQAIEDARVNAAINGIENAEFFTGAAEAVLPEKYRESRDAMRADVIVVDPPRKGCDEAVLDTIVRLEPKRVVYVSCDPATLARDVKYMRERGYEMARVRGCDMFPETGHCETVVLLERKSQ